ncbi:MAG: tautomerase family protein [Methanobacterium sp.]|uniref:tautomerase family protein n=1 Tax=Methanobacterium sp. TaxID=2164 RepID=UPI003D646026|nr:tautomerase family protein [Methanobacterium sp.]
MPLVKIEIRKGKSAEHKKAILDGVHDALVKSIKIPDHDRFQRLYELNNENFESPPNKTDNVTLIEITMFKGRTMSAKKDLYKAIVDNLAKNPGIDGDDIVIILIEPPLENWGIRGGKPANEVDLGFNINV